MGIIKGSQFKSVISSQGNLFLPWVSAAGLNIHTTCSYLELHHYEKLVETYIDYFAVW